MTPLRFEWDEARNRENQRKHGVSFEEARGRRTMRAEYDLTKMKRRRNPYARRLKKQLTIRMGLDIIEHFKKMAEETGIPYQNLINLYLRDCVQANRKLHMKWAS